MKLNLTGTGVALVTPFHKDGSIDFKSFKKLIEHLISNKVEYLVPIGTTGESVTLSKDEKKAIFDITAEVCDKRVKLVAGIGGNNTREVMQCLKEIDLSSYQAVLSVAPYYNKPSQEGIFQHYNAISNESPLPIIAYNVPGRTGTNMTAATTIRIAESLKGIVGIKEASGNIEQCMQIIKNRPKDFLVISGDDNLTLPMIALGADGLISVVANAFPKEMSDMTRLCLAGDFAAARDLHYKLCDITNMLFAESSPAGIKELLSHMGICENHLRLPLVNVSGELSKQLKKVVPA